MNEMKLLIQFQLTILVLSSIDPSSQIFRKVKFKSKDFLKHEHSYPIVLNYKQTQNFINYDESDESEETITLNITKRFKNSCSYFLPSCLCSFDAETILYTLYCNDPNLKRIPNFKNINNRHNLNNYTNLKFSKVDFSHSGIKRINRNDLSYLNLSLKNTSLEYSSGLVNFFKDKHVLYHLDFDNIIEIEDGSFEDFINTNSKDHTLLKMRFSDSFFNFLYSNRKPFKGLKALKLNLNNISNEYLPNTVFDDTIITELFIENMQNFIGFIDTNSLPTGKLSNRFIAIKSYKIDSLCSHSLPSFVDQETFNEIVIQKCFTLQSIKPYTFFKYPHLKELSLASNSFTKINKNSFSYLTQLETLDLSFNPIKTIDDNSFKDLSSLKRLYLESTLLKVIQQNMMTGLIALQELKLGKTISLNQISSKALNSCKKTLKELNLKETNISLIEAVLNDGIEPPYIKYKNSSNSNIWIDGLNLIQLNIDSSINTLHFENQANNITICKLMRYLSPNVLVNLNRNQTCNCLVYFIFKNKNLSNWEYKTPSCYRSQIEYHKNGTKSFEKIEQNESKCNLIDIELNCFVNQQTTTTQTTTVRRKIVIPTPSKTKTTSLPKLDFKKLFQVISVIIFVTIISIFLTIVALKRSQETKKRKKQQQANRLNMKSRQMKIMMPPSAIPDVQSSLLNSKYKMNANIKRLVASQTSMQTTKLTI